MNSLVENKNILALIPARGGSTGVPGKNIKPFCGKPLIAYTIEAALQSGVFNRIVVSTDSAEIATIAKEYGAEVPYLRPADLATSNANVADAVVHMLNHLREHDRYEPDHFYLLQATSPLRDADDIRKSLELFRACDAPGLISVCRTHHQTFNIIDGKLKMIAREKIDHINRQELPQTYKQDGSMIYLMDTAYFRQHISFDAEGMTAYVVPKWKAVDIDDSEDWQLAEVLFKNRSTFTT
jgi:CMP-N,N'-diacetyllegionaminic acid synthase